MMWSVLIWLGIGFLLWLMPAAAGLGEALGHLSQVP